jgi:hypothetical protein
MAIGSTAMPVPGKLTAPGNAGAEEADRTQRRWCWPPGIGLVCWAIFNVLAIIATINYAASGDWANFSEFGMGALLSWIRFAIAASGKVPPAISLLSPNATSAAVFSGASTLTGACRQRDVRGYRC